MKIFFLATLSFFLFSCASVEHRQWYREVHSSWPEEFHQVDKVHLVPMDSLEYEIVDGCEKATEVSETGRLDRNSACMATSMNNAVFDFNTDFSSLKSFGGNAELIFPGAGPVAEEDTLFDSLLSKIKQWEYLKLAAHQSRDSLTLVYDNRVPNLLLLPLARLYAEYGVKKLVLPLESEVRVWPRSGGEGRLELKTLISIWNTEEGKLLYLGYWEEKGEVREPKRIDKRIWLDFFRQLHSDLIWLQNPQNFEVESAQEHF